MKRLLRHIWAQAASRYVLPAVLALFFLLYIAISFYTEEAFQSLLDLTRRSLILQAALGLIPLNRFLRIVAEGVSLAARRRGLREDVVAGEELFHERVKLPGEPDLAQLERPLENVGYRTRSIGSGLAAWRGVELFPARVLFLAATLALFLGILISVVFRVSERGAVIEGEPFPSVQGEGGRVERIALDPGDGPFLLRKLSISLSGAHANKFGVYPPSRYRGYFVYPRYLGIAAVVRFAAPDTPFFENHAILSVYPPGREETLSIPDSPYRIRFFVIARAQGDDYLSYVSDPLSLRFRLLKGDQLLLEGHVPKGGEFARDGYRIQLPELRRTVVTDFVADPGVILIWCAGFLFLAGSLWWLPVRLLSPRREMFFTLREGSVIASSWAEGRRRRHGEVFHEALDRLEMMRVHCESGVQAESGMPPTDGSAGSESAGE